MEVDLIRHTDNIISLMCRACEVCTGRYGETKFFDEVKLVKKVLRSGHESIAEHVVFTFLIKGISRACSHQLVRYRHCSFSQLSQRYAKVGTKYDAYSASRSLNSGDTPEDGFHILNEFFVLPKSVEEIGNDDKYEKLVASICDAFLAYHDAIKSGMKPEYARAILPNCTKTDLLVTMNLREFMHICNERLCNRAQGEIRELVQKMRDLVLENLPELEEFLVPKCKKFGVCTEEKSCGITPKMEER